MLVRLNVRSSLLRSALLLISVALLAACAVRPSPDATPEATIAEAGRSADSSGNQATRRPLIFETSEFVSDKLDAGQPIRIVNEWGNIELRKDSRSGAAQFTAAVQRIGDPAPASPRFRERNEGDVRTIEIEFPGARLEAPRSGRVDLAVFVPAGHPLTLEARDGLIKAKKTANPIHARTTSGDIYLVNDGPIDARSVSGRVQVRPMYDPWGTANLVSESGPVVVFLPAPAEYSLVAEGTDDVRAEIALESNGSIHRAGRVGARNRVLMQTAGMIEIYEALLPEPVAQANE